MVMTFSTRTVQDTCPRIDSAMAAPVDVVNFLTRYKPIECDCCGTIVGFMDRQLGRIKCNPQPHSGGVNLELVSGFVNCSARERTLREHEPKALTNTGNKTVMEGTAHVVDGCNSDVSRKMPSDPAPNNLVTAAVVNIPAKKNPLESAKINAVSEEKENPFFKPVPAAAASTISPAKAKVNTTSGSNGLKSASNSVGTYGKALSVGSASQEKENKIAAQAVKTSEQHVGVNPINPFKASKPNHDWMKMKYSPKLKSGAEVKATFTYALNKYQVQACEDEDAAYAVQDEIAGYVATNPNKTYAKLNRKPVVDEVVLGCYNEEDHYRARVIDVRESDCSIIFIDFGDIGASKYDTLYEISEDLFQAPIYSLTLGLLGVPREVPKIAVPKDLNNRLYDKVKLELLGSLQTSEAVQVDGVLRDNSDQTINERVLSILNGDKN